MLHMVNNIAIALFSTKSDNNVRNAVTRKGQTNRSDLYIIISGSNIMELLIKLIEYADERPKR